MSSAPAARMLDQQDPIIDYLSSNTFTIQLQ
jgi:hypothetical protein